MIKSNLNTYGFWVSPIFLVSINCFFIFVFLYNSQNNEDLKVLSIFIIVSLLLTLPQIISTSKLYVIDSIEKTIVVTHLITRKSYKYNFNEIDGYIDIIERQARGNPYRVIYLVQNGVIIERISAFIYSNIDEMENEFKNLEYLGRRKFSYFKNYKYSVGKKLPID